MWMKDGGAMKVTLENLELMSDKVLGSFNKDFS
jgi:hypothetical protein